MHPGNVGARLQRLRRGVGLSVRTLAAQSGLSPSLISQVERGQVTPSLESLARLTRSLGVSLGTFFAALESRPPRVVRARTRPSLLSPWARVTAEALAPLPGAGTLEPLMLTLAPGGRSEHAPVARVPAQFALLVEGEAVLTLGDAVYVLCLGDAITFSPTQGYQWAQRGAGPARVLLVTRRVVG
jgi:transcriptional regulator with XRE-family HTH domain